jgi:hypothetical protein
MQLPAESRPPEEVERRLVLLHLRRGDEGHQHDAGPAPVDDVMGLGARVRATNARRHERGVGIGGAGADIRRAPVGSARLASVGLPRLPHPVVARCGVLGQGGTVLLRQSRRQGHRGTLGRLALFGPAPWVATVLVAFA